MTTRPLPILVPLLTLVLAACSATGGGGTGPGGPDDTGGGTGAGGAGAPSLDDLRGRTFLSTGAEGRELVAGSVVRVTFTADGVSASGGCNTMGGTATIADGRLTTGALMMTEMACPEPLMAQDAWLAGLLSDAAIDLAGNTLILEADGVRLIMGDEQAVVADRPLGETLWRLESIITGEAASSVPADVELTLRFSGGRVEVLTGCNGGNGEAELREGSVAFGPLASTKMACAPERMALEATILGLLAGDVPYTLDGDRLTLGTGPTQLVYRAD